ncbi:MAG: hypothetical protein BGN94_00900 [Rhizobiales bacterium 68-8]|nr:MAG: hypothetical protein BGN94_00900 [Rhizobiales bacterium 68-8]
MTSATRLPAASARGEAVAPRSSAAAGHAATTSTSIIRKMRMPPAISPLLPTPEMLPERA